MRDADQKTGGNIARNLWMMLSGVGIIMLLGVITGFLSQHNAQGGGALDLAGVAVLGAIAAAILILAFVIWKLFQQGKQSGEKVPRREKVYNRFLIGSFLFGGATGLVLALTGSFDANENNLFATGDMSPSFLSPTFQPTPHKQTHSMTSPIPSSVLVALPMTTLSPSSPETESPSTKSTTCSSPATATQSSSAFVTNTEDTVSL